MKKQTHKPGSFSSKLTRVAICQPLVPAYRRPVFEALSDEPTIRLTVFAGVGRGSLRGIEDIPSFKLVNSRLRILPLLGRALKWQSSNLRVACSRSFDVAILSWDAQYITLPLALLLGRVFRKPTILWGHGYSKRRARFASLLRNALGRAATAVLVYDNATATSLVTRDGFSKRRVFCAQNALDEKAIAAARQWWLDRPDKLDRFRNANGLAPASTILFVSRLERENRVDLLLESLRLTRQVLPSAKLVIIGDGPERSALTAQAKILGVEGNTVFLGPVYNELELAPWMLSSTLLCYPRNMGLTILHAFAYGLPVVTGDCLEEHGPEVHALVEGRNGLLFQDGNAADMSRKCLSILSSTTLRGELSASALRQVNENWNLSIMIAGFLAAIQFAVGTPKGDEA